MKVYVFLAFMILVSSAFAMTDDDRVREAKKAIISINTLMPDKFQNFNAEVDKNNNMNIWFNCAEANLGNCLSGILGAYHSACLIQPDMGDLDIYIGTKEDPAYSMHCTKAESNAIWKDLNSVDTIALENLISKLVSNAVDLKSMYRQSYAGPTSAYAGAGKGAKEGSEQKNILQPNGGLPYSFLRPNGGLA
jgi:hypothetical protein